MTSHRSNTSSLTQLNARIKKIHVSNKWQLSNKVGPNFLTGSQVANAVTILQKITTLDFSKLVHLTSSDGTVAYEHNIHHLHHITALLTTCLTNQLVKPNQALPAAQSAYHRPLATQESVFRPARLFFLSCSTFDPCNRKMLLK